MTQPTNYTPTTDFSQQESINASGRSTVNTAALDAELANIETTLDQTVSNLSLIQRDDGRLADLSVDVYTLTRHVLNLMGGFALKGAWASASSYSAKDIVDNAGILYVCLIAHTSPGAFVELPNWARFGFSGGEDAAASAALAAVSAANADISEANALAAAAAAAASATASNTSRAAAVSAQVAAASSSGSASVSATNAANSASAAALSAASVARPIPVAEGGTGATTAAAGLAALGGLSAATLAASSGASLVGFTNSGAGSVSRTMQDKAEETVSIKDFGAAGDGITDDTAAVLKAVSYIETTGRNVLVPPGTYLTDPIVLGVQFYGGTGSFYGNDRTRCVFKRKTDGAGAFVTFGAFDGTIFRSHVGLSGVKIDGGATTNGPAVEAFGLSRSNFNDCHFTGGTAAFRMYGGVSVAFQNCLFDIANRGLHIQDYAGANANKWPNLTKVIGGEIVDNSEYGVWFDGGVLLLLDGVDIEGNGTTRSTANGGVYVGPNVGVAMESTSGESPGVVIRNCWIERNKGIAQVLCESGINQIYSSFFFANGVDYVQYDIRVTGGRYTVKGCDFVFFTGKTAQISQGPSVDEGNYIEVQPETTYAIDDTKTCVNTGNALSVFGGGFPAVEGVAKPLIQYGTDQTGTSNPTISFARAFKPGTNPRIFCQTTSNSLLTIYSVDVYGVNSVGFTLQKKQFNGTAISAAPALEVRWLAVGQAA